MIKNGVPYCDYCNKELVVLREEEALGDIESHGWTDWRTASVHACFECYDNMWEPPCGECETHPCQKGRECWANPPLHLFPYETYFANKLGETYTWKIDAEAIEETESENESEKEETAEDAAIRRRQLMRLAGQHPKQKQLLEVV